MTPKVTSIKTEDILALCRPRKIIVQLIPFLTLLVVQLSSQKKFLLTKEGKNEYEIIKSATSVA